MNKNFSIDSTRLLSVVAVAALVLAPAAMAAAQGENGGTAPRPAAAPNDPSAVSTEYLLGAEDTLEVFVWNEDDISTTVMVRPDGKISLPLINELQASGRTAEDIRLEIQEKLRDYIDNPVVSVVVRDINSSKISVLGEVRDPGRFLLRQKTTVLDAIAMAGGFTEYADRSKVIVIRNDDPHMSRIEVNVNDLLRGENAWLLALRPNDTVYVR